MDIDLNSFSVADAVYLKGMGFTVSEIKSGLYNEHSNEGNIVDEIERESN